MDLNKSNTTRDGTGLALVATSSSEDDRNDKKRKRETTTASSKWEGYSQEELSEQLKAIFRQARQHLMKEGDVMEFPQEEALSILRACPKLMAQVSNYDGFEEPEELDGPLRCFLEARANLETIQELCQLYNESGGYKDEYVYREWNPVCDACSFWNQQDGVIKCLADHFPDKLLGFYGDGKIFNMANLSSESFPLRQLLEIMPQNETSDRKVEVIDALLIGNPHILDTEHGQAILYEALEGRFGTTIMHCLFSKGFTRFSTMTEDRWSCSKIMDIDEACALSRALPNLTYLEFRNFEWTYDGYKLLLDSIYHAKPALNTLAVPIFPDFLIEDELHEFVGLLRLFIKQSKSLKNLIFDKYYYEGEDEDETSNHDVFMDFFRGCIMNHPTIEVFHLGSFRFNSPVDFSNLLSIMPQKRLTLNNTKIVGGWTQSDVLQHCGIESLVISNCDISSIGFQGFLFQLSDMPKLAALAIRQYDRDYLRGTEYVADVLVQLLNTNIIEEIVILGYFSPFIYQAVYNALITNTSLKRLYLSLHEHEPTIRDVECFSNILRHHNSSLITEPPPTTESLERFCRADTQSPDVAKSEVNHFLRLNRFGRINAQRPDITKSGIVSLLSAVLEPALPSSAALEHNVRFLRPWKEPRLQQIDKFNIQHGLLAECPGVWSSP